MHCVAEAVAIPSHTKHAQTCWTSGYRVLLWEQRQDHSLYMNLLWTQVYHPNLDLEGNICLNILREDWKPVLSINSVLYGLNFIFIVRPCPIPWQLKYYSTSPSANHADNLVHDIYLDHIHSFKGVSAFNSGSCN